MLLARLFALLLLVFGLLPIVNWIPGGYRAAWFRDRMDLWLPGTTIVLGVAAIAYLTVRRWPALWRDGIWTRAARLWHESNWRGDLLLAVGALVLYAAVALCVFDSRPIVIDEIIQVFQARVFATGRLWLPVPESPELQSAIFLIDSGSKLYGQFPPGGPAMIALGTLVGAEWLVGPFFGAISVLLLARLMRRVEGDAGPALATVLLFAASPFVLFMSGTLMNHVTSLTFLLAAGLALVIAVQDEAPRPWAALWCGLALGIAATIRPLDAVTVALPTAVWLLYRLRQGRDHAWPLVASGLGVLLPILALLYVNLQWTGDAFLTGYEVLWGKGVGVGFGDSPWGEPHTPRLGLELLSMYVLRLQSHFFETPVPSLLFATATLALVRSVRPFERWTLCCSMLLLVGYFAYWHDGYHLGPRFMFPLAPWLAWWTVRLPGALRQRAAPDSLQRFVVITGVVALAIGFTQLLPVRLRQYRLATHAMPGAFAEAAREAGIDGATIVVRESWGAQLIARMWALGVSRATTEMYYRSTDACVLESAIGKVEHAGGTATDLERELAPSRADIPLLVALRVSSDTTLRALPGASYSDRCMRRVIESQAGNTIWPPALLANDGNIWIRDLHARADARIDFSRPVWLMISDSASVRRLAFRPINVDSMRTEWRLP